MSTAVVAMVGAGQLARMTHRAAIDLGVELRVLAGSAGDPAVRAGARHVIGDAGDLDALRRLADGADVVTFDHERIPPEHLVALEEEGIPLAPSPAAKLLAQDKLVARRALRELGCPVPLFAHATTRADVARFLSRHGGEAIAKAPRGGYDGRGVTTLRAAVDPPPGGLVLEPLLQLERELAVLVARTAAGQCVAYPPVETVQRDAMCRELHVPARGADEAVALATALAATIGATGVMAVELFETDDGLLVNELALRPHNTGHWTIEGSRTSQFEQHLRAVLGWPLGDTALVAPAVTTVNVVGTAEGDPAVRVPHALGVPGAHVHVYGKPPREGRKLGHVTAIGDDAPATRTAARTAAALLEGRAA